MVRRIGILLLLSSLWVTVLADEMDSMPHVKILDEDNFDNVIRNPIKAKLVAFVASWCGHCKQLKPTYEKLAEAFDGEDIVDIAMIDADKYRKIGEKYSISGFPTIKWFGKGTDKPEDYNSGRGLKDFIRFVNEKAGTLVSEDGLSSKTAGVISSLTEKVRQLINAEGDEQANLMKSIKEIGASLDASTRENFKYYERVLSKYASDGAEYVSTEKNRIMKILEHSKNSLLPKQKKSFMQRLNVLKIFSKDEL